MFRVYGLQVGFGEGVRLYEYVNVFLSGCILAVNARYLWHNSANNPAVCCDWKIDFFNVVALVKLADQKFMRYFIKMTRWGRDFPRTRPLRPRDHLTSYTVCTGSFPGGKAVGAWRWTPTLI